jgi:SAM-dependent methyltransferase
MRWENLMEPTTRTGSSYSFDRAWPQESERLRVQCGFLDPGTIRHLEALRLQPGWLCAEIGAGTGSIAAWMSERVHPAGRVVATDIDLRFLAPIQREGLEVRRHDIVAGPLEGGTFDLVHARLLLMHLPERERALTHMVESLRPGGWLLIEEYDLATAGIFEPPSELQEKVNRAVQELFASRGGDARYGAKLVSALQGAGLEHVQAEALGSSTAEALALKLEQFRGGLVEAGLLSEEEVQRAIAEVRTPRRGAVHYQSLMVAAWGRRPLGTA